VIRGGLALVCNLTERARAVEMRDVVLASAGLASLHELPPLACALIAR
jgi:hypothetical protein